MESTNILKTETMDVLQHRELISFVAGVTKELKIAGIYRVERLMNAVKIYDFDKEMYTHIYQCHLPRDIERITRVICGLYEEVNSCDEAM